MSFRRFVLALLIFSGTASADVEKIAERNESGLRLIWWPKVDAPKGWHFDEGSSHHHAFKAFAPNGSTFPDAETVLYAEANFKPRSPSVKSIEALIAQDISGFSGAVAEHEEPLLSGDRKPFQVVAFLPKAGGNWERVAYGEEPEYFIVFTVSSRTKEGLAQAVPAFQALVANYKVGP